MKQFLKAPHKPCAITSAGKLDQNRNEIISAFEERHLTDSSSLNEMRREDISVRMKIEDNVDVRN